MRTKRRNIIIWSWFALFACVSSVFSGLVLCADADGHTTLELSHTQSAHCDLTVTSLSPNITTELQARCQDVQIGSQVPFFIGRGSDVIAESPQNFVPSSPVSFLYKTSASEATFSSRMRMVLLLYSGFNDLLKFLNTVVLRI